MSIDVDSPMNFPTYNGHTVQHLHTNLTHAQTNLTNYIHSLPGVGGGIGGAAGSAPNAGWSCSAAVDGAAFSLFRVVVDVGLVSALCLLGFVGNALTIVILWRDRDKKSPTNWLLQSLAVVDIVYLVACVFIQPLKTINDATSWLGSGFRDAFTHAEPYVWALASVAQTVTVWIVMLVTVDRYVAICHPLRGKMRTLGRARAAVSFVVVAAFVYNIPLFLEREVELQVSVRYRRLLSRSSKSCLGKRARTAVECDVVGYSVRSRVLRSRRLGTREVGLQVSVRYRR